MSDRLLLEEKYKVSRAIERHNLQISKKETREN